MTKTIEKIADLEYNELVILGIIEQNNDLKEIFTDEIKIPFTMLYSLQKEGKLNNSTKELLVGLFENLILTSKDLINKYQRLMQSPPTPQTEPIEVAEVIEVEEVVEQVVEPIKVIVKDKVSEKKEALIPRRYGKEKITKDIEAQGGVASPVQRAMLKGNTLKNIYVNLNNRLIKDYFTKNDTLNNEDYRKITSAIKIIEQVINPIIKKS